MNTLLDIGALVLVLFVALGIRALLRWWGPIYERTRWPHNHE